MSSSSPPEPRSEALALDVAIVSYRCEGLLRDCLRSLEESPPAVPMTVHVFDNASGDGTAEMVAREFPGVELTANAENVGFSVANNRALAGGRAPFVCALNPDTRILPGALDRLLEVIAADPLIGIIGPRLELEDGSFDHASRRAFPTPLGALGHFTGVGRGERAPRALAQYRAPEVESGPVDAVNGAFMLMRRDAFEALGGFDESYWMYMEDLDLCYRFGQAGWKTWYEPSATVIHVKAGTSGKHRAPRLNYAFHRGMLRFYRSHYAQRHNPAFNAVVYAGIALKLGWSLLASAVRRRLAPAPARPATGTPGRH